MQAKIENKNGVFVCTFLGDIDITTSPELKKTFDNLLKQKAAKLVINLAEVKYIDSSGLATLVEALKNFKKISAKLKLTNLEPKVRGLFEITKLDTLFDIMGEEEDALQSFK